MKAWKKWAIVGAVWGLVSGTVGLLLVAAVFGHQRLSREAEILFMTLFLPGFIGMVVYQWIDKVFSLGPSITHILLLPIVIGVVLALLLYRIYILFRRE